MRILISNDDGYKADGIIALRKEIEKIAEVTVVAPESQRSATGHSITLNKPIKVIKHSENTYSTSGTPTDSAKIGLIGIMKDNKPDMILSGINYGGNIGEDITYSGTLAVAIEGALYNVPSIASSLVVRNFGTRIDTFKGELHYDTAAKFISKFVTKMKDFIKQYKLPEYTFFNINIPNLPASKIKGVSFTSLGRRCYEENLSSVEDPYGNHLYWFTGSEFHLFDDEGTDAQAILQDKISVTPLNLDFTSYPYLETCRKSFSIDI